MHEIWGSLALLAMFNSGLEHSKRFLFFAQFASMQMLNMFFLAFFYNLQYPADDGKCGQLFSAAACLTAKSRFDKSQSKCHWTPTPAVNCSDSFSLSGCDQLGNCTWRSDSTVSLPILGLITLFVLVASLPCQLFLDALFGLMNSPTASALNAELEMKKSQKLLTSDYKYTAFSTVCLTHVEVSTPRNKLQNVVQGMRKGNNSDDKEIILLPNILLPNILEDVDRCFENMNSVEWMQLRNAWAHQQIFHSCHQSHNRYEGYVGRISWNLFIQIVHFRHAGCKILEVIPKPSGIVSNCQRSSADGCSESWDWIFPDHCKRVFYCYVHYVRWEQRTHLAVELGSRCVGECRD
jgi:hypothetical protein